MGLLPTIQRGWVTIDSDIFFWNYETGGDLAYYEGLAEVVLTVGLVAPKPGVFQPHIKFLLVVCTASEIVVLGVTFESEGDDQYALMHLQPNPLFAISSDGVNVVQVRGTPEGRIFLAGANGHLYELQYQSYLSWFGKRCKLVNQSSSYFSFLVPSVITANNPRSTMMTDFSIASILGLPTTKPSTPPTLPSKLIQQPTSPLQLHIDGLMRLQQILQLARPTETSPSTPTSTKTPSRKRNRDPCSTPTAAKRTKRVDSSTSSGSSSPSDSLTGSPSDTVSFNTPFLTSYQTHSPTTTPYHLSASYLNLPRGGKFKHRRSKFTSSQIDVLLMEFEKHPYLTATRRRDIAQSTDMPERSVQIWFSNRRMTLRFGENDPIVQVEYDNTRQTLYTRSDNGNICMYDLGADGQGIGSVCSISQDSVLSEAIRVANNPHGIDSSNFKPIVSICPIKKTESANLALLGVTSSGVRLYFSVSAATLGGRYSSLSLSHIRMPPGFSPNGPPQRPLNVHMADMTRGTVQMCMSQNDSIDVVWSVSPDTFGISSQLCEATITTAIEGRVWALEEAPEPFSFEARVAGSRTYPPTIVCQHVQPARRTVLLTSQGTFILTNLRPVDQLLHLLEASGGADTEPIASFFKLHREKEACATALILACNPVTTDPLVASCAARAFFRYGGEASLRGGCLATSTSGHNELSQSLGGAVVPNEAVYSGKHAGICLYFARLLAPLWDGKLVEESTTPDKQLISRFTCDDLAWFTEQLTGLKGFLDEYAPFSHSDLTDSPCRTSRTTSKVQAEAFERNSVLQLRLLVQYSVEALELWRELCEYQFHLIAERLPTEIKEDLCRATFRDLVVGGKQITVALINALMERYFGDTNLTDALCARLREICPNLYGAADLKTTKANELLQSAKHQTNKTEQNSMLQKSLELYKQVTVNIDLSGICNQYASVCFYEGIVELCLATAENQDNQNLALHLTHTGEDQGEQLLVARRHCYLPVTNTLNNLLAMSQGASGVQNSAGVKISSAAEAERQLTEMLHYCYSSTDEVFHVFLYEWLIGNGLISRLLEVKSSFLEPFLRRTARQPDNLQILDIMWKYYEKERNYSAAARILAKLADRDTDKFTLWDRVDYISRAILCAKACSTTLNNDGEFLHELEDKMDVAQLQLSIYSALEQLTENNPGVSTALKSLNSLVDISTLYSEYAEKFELAECQLAIVHCAGHHDPMLVQKLWRELLNQELTSGAHLPMVSMMNNLRSKIETLGRTYQSSEKFFPLQFLVQQLEVIACKGGWGEGWVVETLLSIPVSYPALHSTYSSLIQLKLPCWNQLGQPYHLHIAIKQPIRTRHLGHVTGY
eukprot:sb/3461025/